MVLIFDLDDTLYEELSYVRSGFRAVAKYINQKYNIDQEIVYRDLYSQVLKSRKKVFNIVFAKYGLETKSAINKSLIVYRSHVPEIILYNDAVQCFKRYFDVKKYVVTDGNKFVQNNKCHALKLEKYMEKCFITHRYGVKNAKPSPYIFNLLAEKVKTPPSQMVYVADNPNKDFIGIKPLGFITIRVKRGMFENITLDKRHEADKTIYSLDELTYSLLETLL
jgi:putative hydrolase of the HAD superfamily